MAYRDRSQGFGFVYVDLKKLLSESAKFDVDESAPVEFESSAKTIHVTKESIAAAPAAVAPPSAPVEKLKENLDRLQQLQHKLHAMLEELSTIADKEKKRRKKD